MPFLPPKQQCQSIEGESISLHGRDHLELTWGLPPFLSWEACQVSRQPSDAITPGVSHVFMFIKSSTSGRVLALRCLRHQSSTVIKY